MIGRDSRDDMALGLLWGLYFTGPLLNGIAGQEVAEAEANWPGSRRSTYRYKRDEDRWDGGTEGTRGNFQYPGDLAEAVQSLNET